MLSSFINQATADGEEVDAQSPVEVRGRARPSVAHPFARVQSTSELPGRHRLSTAALSAELAEVVVV